ERIEKNQDELKQTDEEIKALLAKNETNDDELVEMYSEKESIEQGVNEAEKEYYSVRGSIDDIDKSEREIQRSRENVDAIIMELQNKLNETKLELSSVKERLSVEFNIDLDSLMEEEEAETKEESVNESSLREDVLKIRDRMERIGPINPMAMEAYNEIKERNDFIVEQREDLHKAKESLLATIDEIDTVAKETFLEAYEKIKENFVKVFRSLFTEEDDCDLRLSDPENPLESSIEIIAKPKGKRPLTINQLSGGEKTLTATSLLFAIYLIKPAPFCIFDEVDALLDDANIDKFNNIIKTFSKDSQFIIVTHNKWTMASTDIIYGITMIEQGVSRVVPVDLRELADDI
ncbi:MAG: AAA family ATPase, partial [Fulvivirga sp.]